MRFSPNPMEFGALDDFEKFHKDEVLFKFNENLKVGCK